MFVLPMLFGALTAAHGQLVTPKTVPVHQDEQFAIYPSTRAGMGGVSIALDDSLSDPFVNPAKAWMAGKGVMFAAPFDHNITGGHGGGRTLPLGGIALRGAWAASFVAAWQDLDHTASSNRLNVGSSDNRYTQLGVARRLPNDFTIGASAYYARLHAIDGFDILYDGSDGIVQKGSMSDVRLGVTKSWGDRRFELMVLNDRTELTNAVEYYTVGYSVGAQGMEATYLLDHDLDRTNVWGAHTQYVAPLGGGWRLGWLATANRLTHPKIPNYNIKNTPTVRWDPGSTWAYDFGVGLSHSVGLGSIGVDFIQEPMSSRTWGDAQADMLAADESTIRAGEHTVDNEFRFSNSKVRLGIGQGMLLGRDSASLIGLQFGLAVGNVSYDLDQTDNVRRSHRTATEGWTDWSPTFGAHLRIRWVDVRYNYRLTCARDCGMSPSFGLPFFGGGDKVTVPPAVSVIAAPTQAVNVDGGTARMHQLMVSVPIR